MTEQKECKDKERSVDVLKHDILKILREGNTWTEVSDIVKKLRYRSSAISYVTTALKLLYNDGLVAQKKGEKKKILWHIVTKEKRETFEICVCGQPKLHICPDGEIMEAIKMTAKKQAISSLKQELDEVMYHDVALGKNRLVIYEDVLNTIFKKRGVE